MIKEIFNCISIHNGGGIIYLTMMHPDIDKKGNLILLDDRARNSLLPFHNAETKFFKKNIFRNLFVLIVRVKYIIIFRKYLRKSNKNEFFKEYYLNGIPPFFRFPILTNKVFILSQNKNLFNYINYFDSKLFFKLDFVIYHLIHSFLINCFLRDTDSIIVQTKSMKKTILSLKPKSNIILSQNHWKNLSLEFYNHDIFTYDTNFSKNLIKNIKSLPTTSKTYFYPASFEPHKNHKILFKAFNKLTLDYRDEVRLIVTIDSNKVPFKYRNNDSIIFLGKQPIRVIHQIYKLVDFLIFPSINESLGLPLIEASLYNLPVMASKLEYVYDVCKPKYTFNPFSADDIYNRILESIS